MCGESKGARVRGGFFAIGGDLVSDNGKNRENCAEMTPRRSHSATHDGDENLNMGRSSSGRTEVRACVTWRGM